MNITRIDSSATLGTSPLHRASAAAKLIAFALIVLSVVTTTNLLVVIGAMLALLGVAVSMRLPMRLLMGLAAYPGLFAALFALAAGSPPLVAALVVAKAVAAALAAVTLMLTTPYPQVFAPVQRVLPGPLGDILLMTYRSLFLLLEKFGHMLTAARLRAGLSGRDPVRSARLVVQALGGVLLYSLDLSQRTYDVMQLRGYEGRLVVGKRARQTPLIDAAAVAFGSAVAATAIVWRAFPGLAPVAWLPLTAGALMLLVGLSASLVFGKERT